MVISTKSIRGMIVLLGYTANRTGGEQSISLFPIVLF